MPLTELDEGTALVVIDLQQGIVSMPCAPHSATEVVERTKLLAQSFRDSGLPVVLVNVNGRAPGRTDSGGIRSTTPPPDWADIVPELKEFRDYLITKQRPGAFLGTGLDELLRQNLITQVVLTGVSTSNGIEATARSALDLGYNVTLVEDAVSDLDLNRHNYCVETVFPRIGEVTNTTEVLGFLQKDRTKSRQRRNS
jgi:nicotinamidase-related amidase